MLLLFAYFLLPCWLRVISMSAESLSQPLVM